MPRVCPHLSSEPSQDRPPVAACPGWNAGTMLPRDWPAGTLDWLPTDTGVPAMRGGVWVTEAQEPRTLIAP